jgi:Ni/Fe-hydrogenase subunit HybB-like protein
MWNEHSFLFEVFWCVILYFTVTAIELAPTVLEKLAAERAARALHHIAFAVVVVGISLSSLHHSSLGSLFLVTPLRLHPLWYSPFLPLLFILSAMGAGIMFVVLIRIVIAHWYDREAVFGPTRVERELLVLRSKWATYGVSQRKATAGPEAATLTTLASIGTGILAVYFVVQLAALGAGDGWRALLAGAWESWLFGGELLLLAIVPIVLVWLPATRGSPTTLGVAACSATLGLGLNRLDVGVFGYFRDAGEVYFPSLIEWTVSIGVWAAAGLVFLEFVESMPIFPAPTRQRARPFGAAFDSLSGVWHRALRGGIERTTLIGVLVIPVAWAAMYPRYGADEALRVTPAFGLDPTRDRLRIDGNRTGVQTEFPHAEHQERLGGDSSCVTCHHLSLPGDETTACSRCHRHLVAPTRIFEHAQHQAAVAERDTLGGLFPVNRSCVVCHGESKPRTARSATRCLECHEEDTDWAHRSDPDTDFTWAVSYMQAMHDNCAACHEEEAPNVDRPELPRCSTCHSSLTPRDVARAAVDTAGPTRPPATAHDPRS